MRLNAWFSGCIAIGILSALTACGGGGGGSSANDTKTPAAENSAPIEASVAYERLVPLGWWPRIEPSTEENEDQHSFVVRGNAQWDSAWRYFNGGSGGREQPTVDFAQSMLVGVSALGMDSCSPSGPIALQITSVLESDSRISVRYGWRPIYPDSQEMWACAAQVPTPFVEVDFVKIKASSKPVDFIFDGYGSYQNGKLVVSESPDLNPNGKIRELSFEPILDTNYVEVPDRTTYVADSGEKWQSIWSRFTPKSFDSQMNPVLPVVPAVDFSTSKVVGVTYVAIDGCMGLSINRIVEDDKHVIVEFEHTSTASAETGCTQDIRHLRSFAKIGQSSKPVQFRGIVPSVLVEGEGVY